MIAAAFLPACTAAWHRGVLVLVSGGWWADLPAAARWAPTVWLAAPAAILSALAIAAAATSHVRTLLVLLGLSSVVHPWLILALAPLALAIRPWPSLATLRGVAAASAMLWLVGYLLTPPCPPPVGPIIRASQLAGAWWSIVGLSGAALVAFDLRFGHRGRRAQASALVMLVVSGGLLVSSRTADPAAFLGLASAVCWWRIAAGARHVLDWQTTSAGRLGSVALILLVPVLAFGRMGRPQAMLDEPVTSDAWQALEAAGSPAVVMTTGGRLDTAVTIWRSGASEAQQSLMAIPPDPDLTSQFLATRAIYAWSGEARMLAMRGMLVAPAGPRPLLWRVLQFERCTPLTPAWVDVGSAALGGQIAGMLPVVEPNRGALLYFASPRALAPQPLDWPSESVQGFEVRGFDRRVAAEDAALAEALARDELAYAALGDAPVVTRLRFDRRGTAPEMLPLTLGGVTSAAWARLYSAEESRPDRRPSICRSSIGQPVTAYAGAPAVISIDVTSPHAVGGGWYGAERSDTGVFRWGTNAADLLFIAHRPQPLVLRLDAQPGQADWASANLRVTLNSVDAHCREGAPPCDWVLPADAMRTGLNVITLHTNAVHAPPPDPRQMGIMLRAAQLVRP